MWELLRQIPKMDELLADEHVQELMDEKSHQVVKEFLRDLLDSYRKAILDGHAKAAPSVSEIVEETQRHFTESGDFHLRRVVNATGVVVHTNLGRAILSKRALQAVCSTAAEYSNLEYNIEAGSRGSRHDHVSQLLCRLTGAEAAMIVNNNAAAVVLCLSALAGGKEVIVSRGEQVEIGGSFRVPEIMEQSGAVLREVGSTNRTKPEDYEKAIREETGALLKVHTSNYRIVGFTRETTLQELSVIAKSHSLPLLYDMGSGLFRDLSRYGIDEPTVKQVLDAGADVVMFSGDKLLGGPQGGLVVGKKEYIDLMKKHPLARAFRVDKMTLAAAEATFYEYQDMERAEKEIPVLRMITESAESLKDRAEALAAVLGREFMDTHLDFSVEPVEDRVGGGAAPTVPLYGYAITVCGMQAEELEAGLRRAKVPVIVRIRDDHVCLSVRTLQEEDTPLVVDAFHSLFH